eukprot:gnl/Carplike_NY0171/15724_a23602_78.p1 GENE.gnl/Carplike_NY0171/15724_a23602_78~~gnl/Carplike_NY0171/15724_a23602_78.p1  ORF type:complete len:301 (-),score=90.68 gnl/Carplike_NY0171/15724_a23602_78:51-884(-)
MKAAQKKDGEGDKEKEGKVEEKEDRERDSVSERLDGEKAIDECFVPSHSLSSYLSFSLAQSSSFCEPDSSEMKLRSRDSRKKGLGVDLEEGSGKTFKVPNRLHYGVSSSEQIVSSAPSAFVERGRRNAEFTACHASSATCPGEDSVKDISQTQGSSEDTSKMEEKLSLPMAKRLHRRKRLNKRVDHHRAVFDRSVRADSHAYHLLHTALSSSCCLDATSDDQGHSQELAEDDFLGQTQCAPLQIRMKTLEGGRTEDEEYGEHVIGMLSNELIDSELL